MAHRESENSLRIRWNPPPAADVEQIFKDKLPSHTRVRSSVSIYGDTACMTATFDDTPSKDSALNVAQSCFEDAEIDCTFDGITVWQTAEQPDLDICAIHGLGGIAADSFQANNKLWLRDFLPHQSPFQSARISTFGYTSGLFDQSSSDRLSDWADYLLEAICNLRVSTTTTHLPVVFIGHSMGGLIVRCAIEHLFQFPTDPKYAGLTLDQCAVLFLATPHDGTAELEFSSFLTEILKSAFGLRRDLVDNELRGLNESATRSKRVWDQMNQQKRVPPIECLTESQGTKVSKWLSKPALLVKQSSAGLVGKYANKMPDCDHRTVCKFASPMSPAFVMVLTRLRALRQGLVVRSRKNSDASEESNFTGTTQISRGIKRKFDQIELAIETSNQHWIVARPLNSFFTGRTEDMNAIQQAIVNSLHQDNSVPKRYVVTGMGGQGKSELCLRVAHELRSKFWGVFWVDVSSPSTAESDYIHIAKRIGGSAQSIDEARLVLANLQMSWMLILDNADDPYVDYQQDMPSGDTGLILMTSRNSSCAQYATIGNRELMGLTKDDARQLLLKIISVPSNEIDQARKDAEKVTGLLGYHPLALLQAGAYVARRHCTLAEYPRVFEHQRQRLLHFLPRQAQSRYGNVYATLEASARILEQSSDQAAKDALDFLSMFSIINCSELPLSVFQAAWEGARSVVARNQGGDDLTHLSPWQVGQMISLAEPQNETWDSFRLLEACDLLESLSLVTFDSPSSSNGSITIHPLTYAWARDRQNQADQDRAWIMSSTTFVLGLSNNDRWIRLERQAKSHLRKLVQKDINEIYASGPSYEVTRTLLGLACLLSRMRDDYEVNALLKRIFDKLKIDSDTVSSAWLPLYELLGRNMSVTGPMRQAISLLEQVVTLRQDRANDDPARLLSQQSLAIAYRFDGQIEKSVALLKEIVTIRESQPEDDRDLLESQFQLALSYSWVNRAKEDLAVLKKAFKIQSSLPEEDPDRLTTPILPAPVQSYPSLAREAVELLQKINQILERSDQKDDQIVLSTKHSLAKAYYGDGKFEEAVKMMEQVVEGRKHLSEDNRYLLNSRGELARMYYMNGQYKKALKQADEVARLRLKTPGDHRNVWRAQALLALCYEADGQTGTAFDLMQNVIALREESVQDDDPLELLGLERLLQCWTQKYH